MKIRAGKSDDSGSSRPGTDAAGKSTKKRELSDGLRQDQQLIDRCLSGEVAAWEDLYSRCQGPLLLLIKGMLRPANTELIDEISARVWYALVANDGAILARFDPTLGNRLTTFMRAVARDEARRYFRAEVRRKERETIAARQKATDAGSADSVPHFLVEDFLITLSPGDRSFCLEHVLSPSSQDSGIPATQAGGWKQTRRIYEGLLAFLGREA